jgi:hypothetical protein
VIYHGQSKEDIQKAHINNRKFFNNGETLWV